MLSPVSPALTGPSASTGSEAMTFISGSATAPGITIVGSSPGCQRSMLSGAPSEPPKNRLEVLNAKLSRGGAGAVAIAGASAAGLESSRDFVSSDSETSYCSNGGAFSAACSSGSSGAGSAGNGAVAVFAPDRKSTRLNSSHGYISYAVFCLKKKNPNRYEQPSYLTKPPHVVHTLTRRDRL